MKIKLELQNGMGGDYEMGEIKEIWHETIEGSEPKIVFTGVNGSVHGFYIRYIKTMLVEE